MSYCFYGWEKADVRDANGLTPRDHYDLLTELWSAETCAPRMCGDWSPENRTLGQCSITAFLMQDMFGGRVFGVLLGDGNFHCYNVVGDCVFDLTSEQFGDTVLSYENNPEQFRETHFAKKEKRLRYELLRKRFKQEYAVLLKHSGYNCCQAVLCAFAPEAGLPVETLRKMGAAFGVGMGGMEATCGALCAAEMLLGCFAYQDAPILRPARTLHRRFTEICGASICKDLKGLDTGCILCDCDDCVRNAVALSLEFMGSGGNR